jgi:hypothetical protein
MKSYKCAKKKCSVSVPMFQDSLEIKFFKMYQVLTAKMGLEIQISVLVPLDRGLESWYLGDLGGGGFCYSISESTDRRGKRGSSLHNERKGVVT